MAGQDNALKAPDFDIESENDKEMIIECPNCKTKFSVSAELVAGYEMPRFHCSRCDHVFDLQSKPELNIEAREAANLTVSRPTSFEKPQFESPVKAVEPTSSVPNPDNTPHTFTPLQSSRSFGTSASESDRFKFSPPTSTEGESRSLQIPKELSSDTKPSAPHERLMPEQPGQIAFPFSSLTSISDNSKTLSDNSEDEAEKGPEGPAARPTKPEFTLVSSNFSIKPQAGATAAPEIPVEFSDPTSTSEYGAIGIGIPDSISSRVSPWRSFFLIASPMIFLVIALSGVSYYLVKSPSFAHAFSTSISSTIPQFPPAALHITNLRFQKIALDSGQIVPVITGRIRNNSKSAYREVILEGLAFGKNGQVLAQTKINASSSIAPDRIKSLPLDLLRSLQSTGPEKIIPLAAGEDLTFSIALIEGTPKGADLSDATYYSARVYSIKN